MDQKVWQWKHPWEKKISLFCYFLYLILLLRQHIAAAENGYSQEQKNVPDTSKLDSLSNFLPYDTREYSEYKRGSSFFPLRGKKLLEDDSLERHQLFNQDDVEDKRSQFFPLRGKKIPDDLKRASYFMPMRGRKNSEWTAEDYDVTDESTMKRASSFMPMRGKKKSDVVSEYAKKTGMYSNDITDLLNPSNSYSYKQDEKRMQSFVPVRGKRSYTDSENINKSNDVAPNHSASKKLGFSKLAKRELNHDDVIVSNGIATSLLEKKKYSFLPMRGRRLNEDDDFYELEKKPSAFMPMRGKKYKNSIDAGETDMKEFGVPAKERRTQLRDIVHDASHIHETGSRVIPDKKFNFIPIRQRETTNLASNEIQHFSPDELFAASKNSKQGLKVRQKRSTFMPMRGRRLEDDDDDQDVKVDPWPPEQLYSLLDKKSSAFMPVHGRKLNEEETTVEPWQPDQLMSLLDKKSSAFMPMSGRKLKEEEFTVEPWQPDQLMSLLDKKSSAFMPMRGRRLNEEESTVEPWQPDQLMSLLDKKSTFMPMRGRRTNEGKGNEMSDLNLENDYDKRSSSFLPMRGRRFSNKISSFAYPHPYLMAGIGSSLMSKPYSDKGISYSSVRSAPRRKNLRINWDAVKRAFHATRGKRVNDSDDYFSFMKIPLPLDSQMYPEEAENSSNADTEKVREKRSNVRPRVSLQRTRPYLALKRPMSFFATRGKRFDESVV